MQVGNLNNNNSNNNRIIKKIKVKNILHCKQPLKLAQTFVNKIKKIVIKASKTHNNFCIIFLLSIKILLQLTNKKIHFIVKKT